MHNPAFEIMQALNVRPLEIVQDSSSVEQQIALLKLVRLLLSRALLAQLHLPFPGVFQPIGFERHTLA